MICPRALLQPRLLRRAVSCLVLAAALLRAGPVRAQEDECPDPALDIKKTADGKLRIRWDAEAGTVQLVRSVTLGGSAAWTAVTGVVPAAGGGWEALIKAEGAQGFFRLEPLLAPVTAPDKVRLVMDGENFRLEWDTDCEAAGYVVYIGLTPNVGPGNFTRRIVLPDSNSLLIEGLVSGVRYYVTVASANQHGVSPVAPAQNAVFGPNGTVAGLLVTSVLKADGKRFQVVAEGAGIGLQRVVTPPVPAWPVITGSADGRGQVAIRQVPTGDYRFVWTHRGANGLKPEPVTVGVNGLAFGTLDISPAASGSTLFGTALMANGSVPLADIPAFNVHARATVTAAVSGGPPLSMQPDFRGRWIFHNLPPASYPVSLKAAFAGFESNTVVLAAPPAANNPVVLTFPQIQPVVTEVRTIQGGREVFRLRPGQVTVEAVISNPAGLPLQPRWTMEIGDQTITATGASATFNIPVPKDVRDTSSGTQRGSRASFRVSPAVGVADDLIIDRSLTEDSFTLLTGCSSGTVAVWDPRFAGTIGAGHPATVTVTNGNDPATVRNTTDVSGGFFETPMDPVDYPPYTVRVEKPGHMPFLWRFDYRLPTEAQFCVVPAETLQGNMPNSGELVLVHDSSGARLRFAAGCLRRGGTVYNGQIRVEMVFLSMLPKHHFPPGPSLLRADGTTVDFWQLISCLWLRVLDNNGAELEILINPGASLDIPVPANQTGPFRAAWQDWNDGSFINDSQAVAVAGGRYRVPVRGHTLHAVTRIRQVNTLDLRADRTLNYPFDVLIDESFFPVTILGAGENTLGRLRVAKDERVRVQIIDLRQAPGLHFSDPATSPAPLPVFSKRTIFSKAFTPSAPHVNTHVETVSLSENVPELIPEIPGMSGSDQFLTRQSNTKAESEAYYDKINAPATLSEWLALNGLPERLGAPLDLPSGQVVLASQYATAYYYNLGDLGFARAQTMRITRGSDGQSNVAFAVTNYRSLEDARCGRGAVATVCMDNALRTDDGERTPSRYTRFYVYGGDNQRLISGVNFDGSGKKFVPAACTVCHGGTGYTPGGSANLNARFLPFDLESYSFHPAFGVQKTELAHMNNAVLAAKITPAIRDLIEGWYGGSPSTHTGTFNKDFVPAVTNRSWAGLTESLMYQNVFKHNCRVCHISRKDTGVQISSYEDFINLSYGHSSACTALQMPQAQRTWGVFWGSKAASRLGTFVDAPNYLNSFYNVIPGSPGNAQCP